MAAPPGAVHVDKRLPEISRFFGIVIAMFYDDHPPPRFHVRYGRERAIVEIASLSMLEGSLSPRALGLVVEWAAQHQAELRANWALATRPAQQDPSAGVAPCSRTLSK